MDELKVESGFGGTSHVDQALKESWLKVCEIQNKPLAQALSLELDKGQSESIALAVELGIQILVMDETMGRERARAMGLQTIGMLGVLLHAKKHHEIQSVRSAMELLRQEIGFFIPKIFLSRS